MVWTLGDSVNVNTSNWTTVELKFRLDISWIPGFLISSNWTTVELKYRNLGYSEEDAKTSNWTTVELK